MGLSLGVDWASIDGNAPPDWTLAKQPSSDGSRLTFAIMRGAYGDWSDTTMIRDWRKVRSAGLVRGAYLYPIYQRAGKLVPIAAQVTALEKAFELAGDLVPWVDLPPAIDIESSGSPRQAGLSAQDTLAWYTELWSLVKATFGVTPLIYTSGRVWREDLENLMSSQLGMSAPWLAKPWPWAIRTPAQRAVTNVFAGGTYDPDEPIIFGEGNWWIQQYQGDAIGFPGFTNTVDVNRFNIVREGYKSPALVKWIQKRVGAVADGSFGPNTKAKVIELQRKHALVTDGVIGPKTFAPLAWTLALG